MPFHGIAARIVLSALRKGQNEGIYVGVIPGSVQAGDLVAGHRRWCEEEEEFRNPLVNFLFDSKNAHFQAQEAKRRSLTLEESLQSESLSLRSARANALADVPSNQPARHPLGHFEAQHLKGLEVLVCSAVLIFAGVLCSAGGIGGGGIYVTLLMVAGRLSVVDAVPLSKAVVFMGSVPSLVLNVRKMNSGTQTLIDYNICRLVVPCSLMGTLLGVFLNRVLPSWVVLLLLCIMLVFMTAMVTRTTVEQYLAEEAASKQKAAPDPRSSPEAEQSVGGRRPSGGSLEQNRRRRSRENISGVPMEASMDHGGSSGSESKMRNVLSRRDGSIFVLMLFIVVVCAVFHYHAGLCTDAMQEEKYDPHTVCQHPALAFLGRGTLEAWTKHASTANFLLKFSITFPCVVCALVAFVYSTCLVKSEGWRVSQVVAYDVMAVATGILAGLVGIGGGLVFAPFFLLMNLEPGVAVATSSTCVIFTSSSTTLQYLLTDRIIISLALIYGLVNVAASYAGTSFVHFLQDDFHARRSYISGIVGVGVLISAVLSLIKLGSAAAGVAVSH